MSEIRTALGLHEALKTLHRQLGQLQATGRIVMTHDAHNTDWPDSVPALEAALQGIDLAIGATMWMETLAVPDGGYPTLQV